MDKEKVREKFFEMIKESWTYARLTKKEKENFIEVLCSPQTDNCLRGTFRQRWEILQAIYHSFLMALDYNPTNWREEKEEDLPLF